MADWEVWRQDDSGQRSSVAAYPDKVHALACVLVFQAGQGYEVRYPGKPRYEVVGPSEPTVATNRDLYLRLLALGEHLTDGRGLDSVCPWAFSQPRLVRTLLGPVRRAADRGRRRPPARPALLVGGGFTVNCRSSLTATSPGNRYPGGDLLAFSSPPAVRALGVTPRPA